ncbi:MULTISPECIES: hypothetical protein [unclassified Aurantimonas]|uniref:hypothetical protein n=1 Tax=unclassified Aurantimonas TaxID=2638230 RepID=UPI002E17FB60|nr:MULTISPECIES: hypothetical protein [unclassified Aurantimonas]MEC5289436.1 hypothetical protein [Aurantimonas sp. C2-3-R2]MEC5410516.1 hypothetical protein [Aurantimonas sp. C2-4-R8]
MADRVPAVMAAMERDAAWERAREARLFPEHFDAEPPPPKDTDPLEKAADERFNRIRAQYSPNLLRSPI